MSKRGLFIVLEGIDGSGKSTHAKILCEELEKRGVDVLRTGEPSMGIIGEFIRKYAERGERRKPIEVEALLFAADRFEHTRQVIEPALTNGRLVVSDRYLHSSLAYQGAGGLSVDWIREVNKFAIMPDLGILLDLGIEKVSKRMMLRRKTVFEDEGFLQKVRELYLEFEKGGELVKVDADRPIEEVRKDVLLLVERALQNR